MRRDGIELSDEVVTFIAQNVRESVRDLEGVLASLLAHSTLTDREIDVKLAEQVVSHIVAIQPAAPTVNEVITKVAQFYNLSVKLLTSQNRSREVTQARHVAFYLSKELTDCSLTEIGFKMGHRTHATALHSISLIKSQMEFDPVLRQQLAQIQTTVGK